VGFQVRQSSVDGFAKPWPRADPDGPCARLMEEAGTMVETPREGVGLTHGRSLDLGLPGMLVTAPELNSLEQRGVTGTAAGLMTGKLSVAGMPDRRPRRHTGST